MLRQTGDGVGALSDPRDRAEDLSYYARPENYQGTKDSMWRFLSSHRPSSHSATIRDSSVFPSLEKVLEDADKKPFPAITGVWNSAAKKTGPMSSGYYFRRTNADSADERSDDKGSLIDGVAENGDHGSNEATENCSSTCEETQNLLMRKLARSRIRRAINIVLVNMRWIAIVEKEERKSEIFDTSPSQKTFTDIASELRITDDSLTFDPSHFKARKEAMITVEVRQILTTPSWARTSEQIQTAVYGLQHLDAFAEYPLHMREKLCQVGWFQQVLPRRAIIRQGQPPENFYFVLSGQAVVRFLEQNSSTGRNQLRTAAVLRRGNSFGELALLHRTRRTATVVSQDVVQLLAIGKEDFFRIVMGLSPDGAVPNHIQFLSELDFMEEWPIDLLAKNPDKCMFLYFKRGTVMVRDSTKSDWIYIVKSGSCRVLKQLVAVAPQTPKRRKNVVEEQRFPPVLNSSAAFANVVSDKSMRRKSSVKEMASRPSCVVNIPKRETGSEQLKKVAARRTRRYSYAGISSDVLAPSVVSERVSTEVAKMVESVFVEVETLQTKGVFGFRNINFDMEFDPTTGTETSFSLVSKGAECVMLSKKFFIENSSPEVRRRIQTKFWPYPSDEDLQEKLQTQVNWNAYKQRLILSCVARRSDRQPMRPTPPRPCS